MPSRPLPRRAETGTPDSDAAGRRSRGALLAVAGIVIGAGLLLRAVPDAPGDVAGGILYAVLLFLVVAVVTPAAPAMLVGAISLVICVAVEFLQLTDLPAMAAALVPPIRFVLGTTFVASDLLAYLGGTLLAVVLDQGARKRRLSRGRSIQ